MAWIFGSSYLVSYLNSLMELVLLSLCCSPFWSKKLSASWIKENLVKAFNVPPPQLHPECSDVTDLTCMTLILLWLIFNL